MRKAIRVNGPYKHRNKWRVRLHRSDGATEVSSFEFEADAIAFAKDARATATARTVSAAVAEYLLDLRTHGGPKKDEPLKESTIKTHGHRLTEFLQLERGDYPISDLTPARMQSLYLSRAKKVRVDTQRGELAYVRQFLDWCVQRLYLAENTASDIRPRGNRSKGKVQLNDDEGALFLRRAMEDGEIGLACACLLVFGLRANELVGLRCSDLDRAGTVLRVATGGGKTRGATRSIKVPEHLRTPLLALRSNRPAESPLWNEMTRHKLHHHVARICREAGVTVVCPHGLRGTAATLVADGSEVVAQRLLGHEIGTAVTRESYIAPGTVESATAARKIEVLWGPIGDREQFTSVPTDESPSKGELN